MSSTPRRAASPQSERGLQQRVGVPQSPPALVEAALADQGQTVCFTSYRTKPELLTFDL